MQNRAVQAARLAEILKGIRRLVVLNYKGGVGKTTIITNFAIYLIMNGKKVWLFDLDMQQNATVNFIRPAPEENTIADFFFDKATLADIVLMPRENFWLFPSSRLLEDAGHYIKSQDGGEMKLRRRIMDLLLDGGLPDLAGQKQLPDFILFDTAGSTPATTSGFLAAEELLVPLRYEFFSFVGIDALIKNLEEKMEKLDHPLEITGIIPNEVKDKRRNTATYFRSLRKDNRLKDNLFPAIHTDVNFDNAQRAGKGIMEFAPRSQGAKEVARVFDMLLGKLSIDDYLDELDKEAALEEEKEKV